LIVFLRLGTGAQKGGCRDSHERMNPIDLKFFDLDGSPGILLELTISPTLMKLQELQT
jgi:hypothetical protein